METPETKHEPGNLQLAYNPADDGQYMLLDESGFLVVTCQGSQGEALSKNGIDKANAKRIVRAWNHHNDLLAALLHALPYVTDVLDNHEQLACFKAGVVQGHEKEIRAAIAAATKP